MKVTGKNLQLVVDAIQGAIADLNCTMGNYCNETEEEDEQLLEWEDQKLKFERLLKRCEVALDKESSHGLTAGSKDTLN